ncbi:MAG TPA: HD domain-containing protein [Solirubrobacteraceae bacterium]|nr:HD domain-containing protein [Solirubrobacteraceae bacterium]
MVGTLDWTQRTGGRLSRRDHAAMAAQVVRSQLAQLPGVVRRRIERDPREIAIPDTAAARDAERQCDALPGGLPAHSRRTYLYGTILGEADGLRQDAELLYVASMLHDVGVPEAHDDRCFTLWSAERALAWEDPRARRAAEAITLHLNPHVPPAQGVEAHLLRAGAGLDTIRLRAWELSRATRRAVRELHPREGFPEAFRALMVEHARQAPRTRSAWNMRYVRFGQLLR